MSSSQEGYPYISKKNRNSTICHLGDDDAWTPETKKRKSSSSNKRNSGGVLAGCIDDVTNFFGKVKRYSTRVRKKKDLDVIDISSDEESVFEETSSIRSPSPTIATIPPLDITPSDNPRKLGERHALYPIRIAFESKVYSESCVLSFRTGTNNPFISISYIVKGDRKTHKIYTDNNSLLEMSYYVQDDIDDTDDSDDPINILVLLVDASEENGLIDFALKLAETASTDDDTKELGAVKRKRSYSYASNAFCIVVELRSPSEFKENMEIMCKNDTLADMLDNEKAKLSKAELKQFAKPIVEDMEREKRKILQVEELFVERRITRSSRKAKNKSKNGSDVCLVFPFKNGDADELDRASDGLYQLSIEEDEESRNKLPSDVDSKTQYAHYLTIHESDVGRLEQGQFLNDTIIDFWMSW